MSGDIYFNKDKKKSDKKDISFRNRAYVEHISTDQLETEPGDLAFGDIVTEGNNKITHNSNQDRIRPKEKKKNHIFRNILCTFLVLALVITGTFAGIFFYIFSDYSITDFPENNYVSESGLFSSPNVFNILFTGSDKDFSQQEPSSASVTLLSYNIVNNKFRITTFNSRIFVNIPDTGYETLGYAVNNLSPSSAADTIEFNFGIKVNAFFGYDYSVLAELIDASGGITLHEIDEKEAEIMNGYGFDTAPGTDIPADGKTALAFIRTGIKTGTENCAENITEIFSSTAAKLIRTKPSVSLPAIKKTVSEIECSLSEYELLHLGIASDSVLHKNEGTFYVPENGTFYEDRENGQSVIKITYATNIEDVSDFIYNE